MRPACERAIVRSQARLGVRRGAGAHRRGSADASLALLREVGQLRLEQERARGGASLNVPDEEIVRTPDGGYALERRRLLPVEDWNAQLSLMTGMAAAELMIAARVGILRTMPQPSPDEVAAFRRQTEALGRPWHDSIGYGEYLRELPRDEPASLAILQAAGGLFRGAGYEAMDGSVPDDPVQSALAAPYAHVTAPLRRLVDRWGLVICEAISHGRDVPGWARDTLGELPSLMGASSRRAAQLDAASVARVEAAVLSDRIGERFRATVLRTRNGTAVIQLVEPAVTASVSIGPDVQPGAWVAVVLEHADIRAGTVRFRDRLRSHALVVVLFVLHREVLAAPPRSPSPRPRCPRAACPCRRGIPPGRGTRTGCRLRSSHSPFAQRMPRHGHPVPPPYSRGRPPATARAAALRA